MKPVTDLQTLYFVLCLNPSRQKKLLSVLMTNPGLTQKLEDIFNIEIDKEALRLENNLPLAGKNTNI